VRPKDQAVRPRGASTETRAVIGVIAGIVGTLIAVVALVMANRGSPAVRPGGLCRVNLCKPVYGARPTRPNSTTTTRGRIRNQPPRRTGINRGGAPVAVTNYGAQMGRKDRNMFVQDRAEVGNSVASASRAWRGTRPGPRAGRGPAAGS
jgi:hypothetical protein